MKRSKTTTHFARTLRKNHTEAEKFLWHHLRSRQIQNCKFRRQLPVGPYIVDFACLTHKLIIELDGGQHAETVTQDEARTHFLKEKGFQVIRFWNNQVLAEPEAVLEKIYQEIRRIEKAGGGENPSPLPSPPRGEGEGARVLVVKGADQGEREKQKPKKRHKNQIKLKEPAPWRSPPGWRLPPPKGPARY